MKEAKKNMSAEDLNSSSYGAHGWFRGRIEHCLPLK